VNYLELARQALDDHARTGQVTAPTSSPGCAKSEKSLPAKEPECAKSEKSAKSFPRTDTDDDERFICHAIERDLSLPPGSVELWSPISSNGSIEPANERPQKKRSRGPRSRPRRDQLEFQFAESRPD
jgi:hypothetical protein